MKKLFIVIMLLVFSAGCLDDGDKDGAVYYKGIETAEIPEGCIKYQDDVCGLFDCMVDLCWCDDSSPESPVLYEPTGVIVTNEEEAKYVVRLYLEENKLEYEIGNCIKLNSVFFNVFASDEHGDEFTYTVAADGTIIKTFCGV
ncbi:MAG: hypothetical protein JXA98_07480 [Methanosarcinaceae archaeon]|nr:hypothetical protein [Methanosarcinaceae archaeon]